MIKVNLLPHHLRPIKRTPVPYLISAVVVLLVLAGMAFVFVGTQATIIGVNHELTTVKGEIQKLDSVIKEAERLENQKKMVASKIATINEIVAGRIIWSRQLYNLARLAPSTLWYSDIQVDSKQFQESRQVIDPKTKQPKKEKVTVKRPILRVSGYVVGTAGASGDVSQFALAAEEDKEFSDLFQIETSQLSDTEFDGSAVKSFTLEFRILSEGDAQ